MKHGGEIYSVHVLLNLAGLILAESLGCEGLIFFGSVRNTGEFRGSPETREKCIM